MVVKLYLVISIDLKREKKSGQICVSISFSLEEDATLYAAEILQKTRLHWIHLLHRSPTGRDTRN